MLFLFFKELKYYLKNIKELTVIYGLLISIILLVPFGLRSEVDDLSKLGVAILWVALLASVNLGAMRLFRRDVESGEAELYQMLPHTLELIVLIKWAAFWLVIVVPLLLVVPVAGLLLAIDADQWRSLAIGLAAGSLALTALASLGGGLLVGESRAGALLSVITLPLSIPIIIFGAEFCRGDDLTGTGIAFLIGYALLLLPGMALSTAATIRASN